MTQIINVAPSSRLVPGRKKNVKMQTYISDLEVLPHEQVKRGGGVASD